MPQTGRDSCEIEKSGVVAGDVVWFLECFLCMTRLWVLFSALYKPRIVADSYDLRTQEEREGGLEVQGHLLLHRKLKTSLDYERLSEKRVRNLKDSHYITMNCGTVAPWLAFSCIYAITGIIKMILYCTINILEY